MDVFKGFSEIYWVFLFLVLVKCGKIRVLEMSLGFLWCVDGLRVGFILKYLQNTGNRSK